MDGVELLLVWVLYLRRVLMFIPVSYHIIVLTGLETLIAGALFTAFSQDFFGPM